MLHRVSDLSHEQRHVIESLLGHAIDDDEAVSIRSVKPNTILPSNLSPEQRREVLDRFDRYFAKVDSQRQVVSEEEEQAIIDEALRSTRPNYRPAR
jgi:hypothetical protein